MKNLIVMGMMLAASLTLTANAQITNTGTGQNTGTTGNGTTDNSTMQTQPMNRSVIEGNRSRTGTGTMQNGQGTTGTYSQTTTSGMSGKMQNGQGNRNPSRSTDRTTNQQMNGGDMGTGTMPRSSSTSSPTRRDTIK